MQFRCYFVHIYCFDNLIKKEEANKLVAQLEQEEDEPSLAAAFRTPRLRMTFILLIIFWYLKIKAIQFQFLLHVRSRTVNSKFCFHFCILHSSRNSFCTSFGILTKFANIVFFDLKTLRALIALVYDGHSRNILNLANEDLNVFWMFGIASMTEFPADMLLIFTLDRFGRRWLAFGSMTLSGVFSLIAAAITPESKHESYCKPKKFSKTVMKAFKII